MARNISLTLCFFFAMSTQVFAHPVDDAPPVGLQVKKWNLGLQDPAFFSLHKEYWHHRRILEHQINLLTECRGYQRAKGKEALFPEWLSTQIHDLEIYWDNFTTNVTEGVITAHPIEDSVRIIVSCLVGGVKQNRAVSDKAAFIKARNRCDSISSLEIDFIGDKVFAQQEIQAAIDTTNIAGALTGICYSY